METTIISVVAAFLGALVLAYVGYRLFLRQSRRNRWDERQEAAYMAVRDQLVVLMEGIRELAEHEDAEADERPRISSEDVARLQVKIMKAEAEVRKEIRQEGFLLSTKAIRVLKAYMQDLDEDRAGDWHMIYGGQAAIAKEYYLKFTDVTKVEVAGASEGARRMRMGWRWLMSWVGRKRYQWRSNALIRKSERDRKTLRKAFEAQGGWELTDQEFHWLANFHLRYGRVPTAEELRKHIRGEPVA